MNPQPRNSSQPSTTNTATASSATDAPGATHYAFFVLFMVLISTLGSFVNDMFTPALPAICRFYGAAIPTAQLGLTMGMVGLAVGQLFLGPMSDHYGRKPVLVASLSLFVVAAVVTVFSPTIHFFICARLVQGLGASGGYFLARTMPADLYQGRQLAKIMALIGGINGVAPASAPILGGFTSDLFGWQSIFVVLAILGGIILLLTPFVHESLPKNRRTVGPWWKTFGGYKELLLNSRFMTHVTYKGVALGLLFAYIAAAPFILQNHYGMSQTTYGLVIGFNALFVVAGSMIAMKFKPLKKAALVGAVIICCGVTAQAMALWFVKSFALFEVCMCVILFGLGLVFTTTNTLSMNEGRDRAGEASSILGIAGYVVGAVVSPLVGMGNVLHSTAIVFMALMVAIVICAIGTSRIAPDLTTRANA